MRRALVVILFVLSGAAALAYQVAWTRHLVLVFGNTTRAVALILAAYMLGLALGSEFGGRLADRVRRPVLWYAGFEALIGLYALAFPPLAHLIRGGYLDLGSGATPVLFVGAFAVLLVPTFLMGTTLPLLVKATVRDSDRTGGDVGMLYGANIVGAVAGTAITGFWLIEAAGVLGSTRWAAATNILIALLALLVPRLADRQPAPEAAPDLASESVRTRRRLATAALVAAFASGLVGLAAEVVWTRLLVFFLQGFTYTFSAMLAVFLLGLALGNFVFGRVALRTSRPAVVMGRLQIAVGVVAAGVLWMLSHHYHLTLGIGMWVNDAGLVDSVRERYVLTLVLSSAAVLLPPAFLMGGVFPLASAVYQRGLGDLGARIGRLYAVNTVGAVLGSLLAGFVLSPLVGPTWSAAIVAIAAVIGGAVVLWLATLDGGFPLRWTLGGAGLAAACLVAADPNVPFLQRSHVFQASRARENALVETRDGVVCQVSVVRNERDDFHVLYTDDFEAAGTKPEYRYMRLLAHLPVALADDPSRVLVICWGTGTTAGSAGTHPEVQQLDIVEISPQVLEVAHHFEYANKGILRGGGRDDLNVDVHIDDGRNFVLRSREQWGVISLEPLMPYTPAAIHLYTEDFYRECLPRLAPGGLMCQWIPLHGMSRPHLRQLVAAFVNAFPGAAMFHADGAVALIGGHEPVVLDHAQVAERLGTEHVRADLAAIGYDDPVRALGTLVAAGDVLAAFGDVPAMTDENPVLEFHPIPLNATPTHLWRNLQAMEELQGSFDNLPVVIPAGDDDLVERYESARLVTTLLLEADRRQEQAKLHKRVDELQAAVDELSAARRALVHAVSIDPDDPAVLRAYERLEHYWSVEGARGAAERGELGEAERHLRGALRFTTERRRDVVPTLLATILNRAERFREAVAMATDATRLHPRGFEARAERAFARAALGDVEGARRDYVAAYEGPLPADISPRIARDAERVLASPPGPAPPSLEECIESAMSGQSAARVNATQRLRILAADQPIPYAAYFADDVRRLGDANGEPGDRMLSLKRLLIAAPDGAGEAALAVARDRDLPESLGRAATEAVGELAPELLPALLTTDTPPHVLAAAARASATSGQTAHGTRLLDLLDHDDLDVRTAAQLALFTLADEPPAFLGGLDPTTFGGEAYAEAVRKIRNWWSARMR